MSVDNNITSPAVQLFQKAHQNMVLLARVDEQMAQLAARRKALLDELRGVQGQINGEFERLIETEKDLTARMATIAARVDAPAPGVTAAGTSVGANGPVVPFPTQRIDEPALT